jgi:CrcB protein
MNSLVPGYIIVFLGGGIGAILRHGVNRTSLMFGTDFPLATPFVNITGSLVMGLLAGWFAFRGEESNQALRLFLITGVLGGFTTFSAFSLEAALLWERGKTGALLLYVAVSVIISLLSVFAGLTVSKAVFS